MNFDFAELNWLAIAVVCIGTFFLGGFWYTVFGPLWIKFSNYTPEQIEAMKKAHTPAVFFGGMIVSYFIFAVFYAIVIRNMPATTWQSAALAGIAIWLAISVPINLTSWIASNKQLGFHAIDMAYQFVFIVAGAIVLAVWR